MTALPILTVLSAALLLAACSPEQTEPPIAHARPPASTPSTTPDAPQSRRRSPAIDRVPATPRGALPLEPGVYVMAGSDCSAPSNAGLRFYDGVGISGTATHDCRAIVASREGDTYTIDQSCIDTPAGDGPRTIEPQTVTVHDARTFTVVTADDASRFTRCDDDAVPGYLRDRARL